MSVTSLFAQWRFSVRWMVLSWGNPVSHVSYGSFLSGSGLIPGPLGPGSAGLSPCLRVASALLPAWLQIGARLRVCVALSQHDFTCVRAQDIPLTHTQMGLGILGVLLGPKPLLPLGVWCCLGGVWGCWGWHLGDPNRHC